MGDPVSSDGQSGISEMDFADLVGAAKSGDAAAMAEIKRRVKVKQTQKRAAAQAAQREEEAYREARLAESEAVLRREPGMMAYFAERDREDAEFQTLAENEHRRLMAELDAIGTPVVARAEPAQEELTPDLLLLMKELNAMGDAPTVARAEPAQEELTPDLLLLMKELNAMGDAPTGSNNDQVEVSFGGGAGNDLHMIFHTPRLTRYDKARDRVRRGEAQLERLLADPDASPIKINRCRDAIKRGEAAMKAAQSDLVRKQENIDEWRTTPEGREARNTARRKVRSDANAKRSEMTAEERKRHDADKAADRAFKARSIASGLSDTEIADGLAKLKQKRLLKRAVV